MTTDKLLAGILEELRYMNKPAREVEAKRKEAEEAAYWKRQDELIAMWSRYLDGTPRDPMVSGAVRLLVRNDVTPAQFHRTSDKDIINRIALLGPRRCKALRSALGPPAWAVREPLSEAV